MADGSVVIEISGDDSEFKKSLAGLKSDSKKSAGELEQLGQSGKEAGSEIRNEGRILRYGRCERLRR